MWHLLTLGAVVTCLRLSAWQWGRAESITGSALNIGYGLQWPMFAIFFAVMWWRFLRLEVAALAAADSTRDVDERVAADSAGTATDGLPEPRSAQRQPGQPRSGADPPGPHGGSAVHSDVLRPAASKGASPFGPRPTDARPAEITEDSALAAYNRMLGQLADQPDPRS